MRIRGELFETERGLGDVEVGGEGGGMLYFLADFMDTLWLCRGSLYGFAQKMQEVPGEAEACDDVVS